MSDSGNETVGQALLITGVAVGALSIVQVLEATTGGFSTLIAALS